MLHTFNCDNCGNDFITYCFGGGGGVIYESPPIREINENNELQLTKWAQEALESRDAEVKLTGFLMRLHMQTAMTMLCNECINQ